MPKRLRFYTRKINGRNLGITPIEMQKSSEPNLHFLGFQPLIFQGKKTTERTQKTVDRACGRVLVKLLAFLEGGPPFIEIEFPNEVHHNVQGLLRKLSQKNGSFPKRNGRNGKLKMSSKQRNKRKLKEMRTQNDLFFWVKRVRIALNGENGELKIA